MIAIDYVWLIWSSAFLLPWFAFYIAFTAQRRAMLWASFYTMPFGLSEPLFVPEYWSPPSLFNLARTTGFDIESLIFCFGIGGVGAVLYNIILGVQLTPMPTAERRRKLHRFHKFAIAAPFLAFPPLYFLPWNPIYPAIIAMCIGGFSTMMCRPDLIRKTWLGGILFLFYYVVFLWGLEWLSPGYLNQVWNLEALSGYQIVGFPVEELLFAVAFGICWAGIYEHFMWRRDTGE